MCVMHDHRLARSRVDFAPDLCAEKAPGFQRSDCGAIRNIRTVNLFLRPSRRSSASNAWSPLRSQSRAIPRTRENNAGHSSGTPARRSPSQKASTTPGILMASLLSISK